ncbi:MAG TPA: penicillin-binding transpeptidase domain-containing protein [Gemmatimonadaceae bacterium]|nr:penicillin-binding transpeptidase domain-containing protein [Gemmatimonadaceae bacterium]
MVRLSRVSVIHLMLALFAVLLIGQAARVQLFQGKQWAEKARRQQFNNRSVAAPRGNIFDAAGNVLAQSREMFRVSIAPREVKDAPRLARSLRDLRISSQLVKAALDKSDKWFTLPGTFVASDIATLVSMPGVHPEAVMIREYTNAAGIKRIVGSLDPQGKPLGGIEQSLDSLLRGDSAIAPIARDVRGRRLDTPDSWTRAPRPGDNITLTVNRDLQEICERALARAVDSLQATGGDIVVLNPASGEVLAMASRRVGQKAMSVTGVTEPFEPGSTLKPFIAAALLDRGRARKEEIIDTHNGQLVLNGRTINDVHKAAQMSLADVIRYSSNIGIVGFGSRLTPHEKYELLRDLGIGVGTGVPIPGESDGILREPARWSAVSAASVVMGYELSVTPLQLATAYASLANGGELIQPHVIKEIRSANGDVVYEAKRRVIRRVFSERVADDVLQLLRSVVDSGTALKADLASYAVAGKSGTARRTEKGRYVAGNYTASFVGLFPAEKPQYVVVVKMDSPRNAYYGGEVAAPVTSVVLRAAIAARNAALDRAELANVEREVPLSTESRKKENKAYTFSAEPAAKETVAAVLPPVMEPAPEPTASPARVISLPFAAKKPVVDRSLRAVPDVRGLPTRTAVRALHRAGFRVTLTTSLGVPTVPAAGTMLPAGSVVRLQH